MLQTDKVMKKWVYIVDAKESRDAWKYPEKTYVTK